MENDFLKTSIQMFKYYSSLGEKAFEQLSEAELNQIIANENNSIVMIVRHLSGNMLSRWTDFLHSDGEKSFRDRDNEFQEIALSKEEMLKSWHTGWNCTFEALESLTEADLSKIVYIRNEGHTVIQAIIRQLAHYSYHVGQIVLLAKMIKKENWQSLSIAKDRSKDYNAVKFGEEKSDGFFVGR